MELSDDTLCELMRIYSQVGDVSSKLSMNDTMHKMYKERIAEIDVPLREELNKDRDYFVENPDRFHIVRHSYQIERYYWKLLGFFTGEHVGDDKEVAVMIKRTAPNEYIRCPIAYPIGMMPSIEVFQGLTEEEAMGVWETMMQRG